MKNKRFWDWARDSDERVLYFDGEISEVFCARCAKAMLERIRSGEFAALDAGGQRRAVNS